VPRSDTRERLRETAARLFHEQGYAATGVATILREADANSGSLYHFFPNKEALLTGVLEWYRDHLEDVVLRPVEEAEPDPVKRIFRLLDWYRDGMTQSGCRLGCPIGNLALEVSDTHPEVRPLLDENFRGWAAGIRRWLKEAGDRLPADLDRDALSRFVLTVMEGGLMQARASDDLAPFDASVRVLRDHVDRLLGDRKRRKRTAKRARPAKRKGDR
jgi:AcrR family transcriptional regulator